MGGSIFVETAWGQGPVGPVELLGLRHPETDRWFAVSMVTRRSTATYASVPEMVRHLGSLDVLAAERLVGAIPTAGMVFNLDADGGRFIVVWRGRFTPSTRRPAPEAAAHCEDPAVRLDEP